MCSVLAGLNDESMAARRGSTGAPRKAWHTILPIQYARNRLEKIERQAAVPRLTEMVRQSLECGIVGGAGPWIDESEREAAQDPEYHQHN